MLINGDESPIAIFPSAVTSTTVEQLLTEAKLHQAKPGEVTAQGTAERHGRALFLGSDHWSREMLFGAAQQANQALGWNLELGDCESPQIAFYEPEDRYDWHSDLHVQGDLVRKLTVVVQLDASTAYVGGDLQLRRFATPEPELLELPVQVRERGTVVVFPSYQLHRISPVEKGLRRALVGWILGPRYR